MPADVAHLFWHPSAQAACRHGISLIYFYRQTGLEVNGCRWNVLLGAQSKMSVSRCLSQPAKTGAEVRPSSCHFQAALHPAAHSRLDRGALPWGLLRGALWQPLGSGGQVKGQVRDLQVSHLIPSMLCSQTWLQCVEATTRDDCPCTRVEWGTFCMHTQCR